MQTIPLTGGGVAVVDDADYAWASRYRWHTIKSGSKKRYVSRMTLVGGKWKRLLLHREIMGAVKGQEVDHADGDTFNNCRTNLRFATHRQNMANLHRVANGVSGYRGVGRNGSGWAAYSSGVYLGTYRSAKEAARVRDQYVLTQHGKFAFLNFPLETSATLLLHGAAMPTPDHDAPKAAD